MFRNVHHGIRDDFSVRMLWLQPTQRHRRRRYVGVGQIGGAGPGLVFVRQKHDGFRRAGASGRQGFDVESVSRVRGEVFDDVSQRVVDKVWYFAADYFREKGFVRERYVPVLGGVWVQRGLDGVGDIGVVLEDNLIFSEKLRLLEVVGYINVVQGCNDLSRDF